MAADLDLSHLTAPASLRNLALTSVALYACSFDRYIWYDIDSVSPATKQSCCEAIFKKCPPAIEQLLKNRMRSVDNQLRAAFRYLIVPETTTRYGRIQQCFTIGADATVSIEASARNMLNCGSLRDHEKYVIACQCCFEEDVRRFWPSVSNNPEMGEFTFTRVSLLKYWANRMTNGGNQLLVPNRRGLIESLRFSSAICWSALSYLWTECTLDEQMSDIDSIFKDHRCFPPNINQIVTRLNPTQMNRVLERFPCNMIIALSYEESYFEYLVRIWDHCKGFITDDEFCSLIEILYDRVFKCSQDWISISMFEINDPPAYSTRDQLHCDQFAHQRIALNEIWITTPPNLKTAFLNSKASDLLANTYRLDQMARIKCHNHDVKFFYNLLADMTFELRNTTWLQYWTVIVSRTRPKNIQDFLKLCLKEELIDQFVEYELMNFYKVENFMRYLFILREYDDLIDYANLCTANEMTKLEFRLRILEMVVESFKQQQSESNPVIDMESSDNRWKEFWSWCNIRPNDAENSSEFESMDEIFVDMLLKAVKKLTEWLGELEMKRSEDFLSSSRSLDGFNQVDEFLKIQFGDKKAIRRYKAKVMANFKKWPKLIDIFEAKNECVVNDVLRWCFDDDIVEIGNFKCYLMVEEDLE